MLKAELKVVGGSHAGKVISLTKQRFLIGRGEECQLRPASDQISRNHCAFSVDEYTVRLRDLGSTNGTQVNGDQIRGEVILKTGDRVQIGLLEFVLQISKGPVQVGETTGPDTSKSVLPLGVAPDTGGISAADTVLHMSPADSPNNVGKVTGDSTVILPNQDPVPAPEVQAEQYPPPNQPVAPEGQPFPVQPVPAQALPGAVVPYPQAAYPYQQPQGVMYPQQPYPQQPYPQQQYAYPQPGYAMMPGQPVPYPPQPGVAPPVADPPTEDVAGTPELPVKLPPPESTGAAPQPESQKPREGEAPAVPKAMPSTTAADVIKNMKTRRPGT